MKKIACTYKNTIKYALVDNEDYLKCRPYNWVVDYDGYARGTGGMVRNVLLHRFIMNAPTGTIVDHINRKELDNRKCNLRFTTRSQNMKNAIRRTAKGYGFYNGYWLAYMQRDGVNTQIICKSEIHAKRTAKMMRNKWNKLHLTS